MMRWTAWILGFGRALRAAERRRGPFGEAQRHYPVGCVREAVGQSAEAFRWLERGTTADAGGHDVQGPGVAGAV